MTDLIIGIIIGIVICFVFDTDVATSPLIYNEGQRICEADNSQLIRVTQKIVFQNKVVCGNGRSFRFDKPGKNK